MSRSFVTFAWPGGYEESWCGYACGSRDAVHAQLKSHVTGFTALEIGCGNGRWTVEWLTPLFGRIVAVDVIDRPAVFYGRNVEYVCAADGDYSLTRVPNASIDFVWSFGVFCHLPVSARRAYYASIFRVLKSGGSGIVMEPNFQRHPALAGEPQAGRFMETPNSMGWFYGGVDVARENVLGAGLTDFTDLLPEFRDTLGHFRKP